MTNARFNRFPEHSIRTLTAEKVRYDLAESVGPDLLLSDLFSSSEAVELATLSLEYRSAEGSAELRSLIAQQHNVHTDDVITTVGGMHAIFLCGAVLCNENDHVLVQQPSFPLTQSALAFNNAELEYLPCRFEDQYQIDIDYLVSRLKPQTSLVCLATPQNPSGVAISQDVIKIILKAIRLQSPNAFLLLDETYRQATYANSAQLESLIALDERVISCASLSKCHGTPGLRLGWVITRHERLRKQLINGKFQTIICCSGLDEAVALKVLQRSDTLLADRCKHLLGGYETVSAWVNKHSDQISWVPPDAGALCCVRLDCAQSDKQRITQFYSELQQHSVRVAPGDWFGDAPDIFRLGFGLLPIPELMQGLEGISRVLEKIR